MKSRHWRSLFSAFLLSTALNGHPFALAQDTNPKSDWGEIDSAIGDPDKGLQQFMGQMLGTLQKAGELAAVQDSLGASSTDKDKLDAIVLAGSRLVNAGQYNDAISVLTLA